MVDGLTVDAEGAIYVSGRLSHLANFGDQEIGARFQRRAFLAKLTTSGEFVFSKVITGTFDTGAVVVNAAQDGNLYLGGTYAANESGVFVAGYTREGTEQFLHTFTGGTGAEISDIELGTDGKLYICGRFGSESLDLNGIILTNQSTVFSGFVAKLNINGETEWGQIMGDRALQLALDNSNTVFAAGYFQGTSPLVANQTLTNAGRLDIFLSSLTTDGETNWVTAYSSDSNDLARTLTIDPEGSLIFAGEAFHTAFGVPPLAGSVFLAKTAPLGAPEPAQETSPDLTIKWINGVLEISWDSTVPGLFLEATTSLTVPFAEASSFLEPAVGQSNSFRVSSDAGSVFFRLTTP